MTSLLVFDLGNSRCKWAWFDTKPLQPVSNAEIMGMDLGFKEGGVLAYDEDFKRALDESLGQLKRPAQTAAVSVAGSARTQVLADWLQRRWQLELKCFSATPSQLGVTNSYKEAARLGADRWAALIAARARVPQQAVCVIDCGTAVTVDALDAKGIFHGGVILPGLALMRSSLAHNTQAIQATPGEADSALAQNTADAVAAGTLLGLAGAIDRILEEQATGIGSSAIVLLTGGDAPRLQTQLRHSTQLLPHLVLEGVARLAGSEAET